MGGRNTWAHVVGGFVLEAEPAASRAASAAGHGTASLHVGLPPHLLPGQLRHAGRRRQLVLRRQQRAEAAVGHQEA